MKKAILTLSIAGILMNLLFFALLPDRIPMHFNFRGEADRFGSKVEFLLLYSLVYLAFLSIYFLVPLIDPKRRVRLSQPGYSKFFLSIIAAFIIFNFLHFLAARSASFKMGLLNFAIGLLMVLIGNYLPTLKPNYFVGIRTPWTLESERVWKRTHRLGGWTFLAGGILIMISSILPPSVRRAFMIVALVLIILIPVLFSYIWWVREEKEQALK